MDKTPSQIPAETKLILEKMAGAIRQLAMDATEKANSGHPGLPMGCAELGAYLYGFALRYNPKNPLWIGRDRFILSGGHGSLLLYSCLHMAGYDLSLEEIKHFRQLHSKTPGHPEKELSYGIETTTGPLGQGLGNGVGQALGLKMLGTRFEQALLNNKVFVLVTDGCIMEGGTSEVSSLAGHWKLDNLIVFYDSNGVSLDGALKDSCSEDVGMRYRSYGWEVFEIDGHDLNAIHAVVERLRKDQKKPAFIIMHTIIGKGAPHKQGTSKAHGSPLGPEEVKEAKAALGLSEEPFFIPPQIKSYFVSRLEDAKREEAGWTKQHPQLTHQLEHPLPANLESIVANVSMKSPLSGRQASHLVLNELARHCPYLIAGSADLSSSDMAFIKEGGAIAASQFEGRNIKFGVREFGMGTIATGLAQSSFFLPVVGTFLTFSDYMRNAIRLCSLMKEHVIYHFTHDSIFLGEDGPTHQPIEHLAALRAIPNLQVIRPADGNEVKMAWVAALRYHGPTALILSRQNLPLLQETERSYEEGVGRGAYLLKKEKNKIPDYTLIATGSEVALALEVSQALHKLGKDVRLISMPCVELFEKQSVDYKSLIFGGHLGKRVSIEAGIDQGWYKYIGREGIAISIPSFGASAPAKDLAEAYGFTVESILDRIL